MTWKEVLQYDTVTVVADGYTEAGIMGHYEPWRRKHHILFSIVDGCAINDDGYFFNEESEDYYIVDGKLYCEPSDLYYREPVEEDEEDTELVVMFDGTMIDIASSELPRVEVGAEVTFTDNNHLYVWDGKQWNQKS